MAGTGAVALSACGGPQRPRAADPPADPLATALIEAALAQWAMAVDGADAEAFVAAFLPEGRWVPGPTAEAAPVAGHAALRAWHQGLPQRRLATVALPRHQLLNPVITVTGDRATFWAWLQRDWYRTDLNQVRTGLGTLSGRLVRSADGWRCEQVVRTCTHVHGSGPVTLLQNGKQRLKAG
jgi:hypothetical protein